MSAPLTEELYTTLKQNGVVAFELHFSGGDDSGYLNIQYSFDSTESEKQSSSLVESLDRLIEDWAWEFYAFNGTGVGIPFGMDVGYDLKTNIVTLSEWYSNIANQSCPEEITPLKIDKNDESI